MPLEALVGIVIVPSVVTQVVRKACAFAVFVLKNNKVKSKEKPSIVLIWLLKLEYDFVIKEIELRIIKVINWHFGTEM